MEFKKHQHVERLGTMEVEEIEFGKCHIFPKIDGTNASIWFDEGEVQAGSRKRTLKLGDDNAGFCKWVLEGDKAKAFEALYKEHPNLRLFGEWLVPHSLKTYREDAWRNFYVFDVCVDDEEMELGYKHLAYEIYQPILEMFGIEYIPPLAIITQPDHQKFIDQMEKNIYLIEDGKGSGEGLVIKNYDFVNKYGRQTWAKIVTSEFKEKHAKEMGAPESKGKDMIEEAIATKYCTQAIVDKVKAKIVLDEGGWSSKFIPRLLQTVYYDVIREHCWDFVKENKNPRINFKTLSIFIIRITKELSGI